MPKSRSASAVFPARAAEVPSATNSELVSSTMVLAAPMFEVQPGLALQEQVGVLAAVVHVATK